MLAKEITVVKVDAHGNFVRDTVPINVALLEILRFTRKHPDSSCTIELRELETQLLQMHVTNVAAPTHAESSRAPERDRRIEESSS
jgi:hypothetical protein